MRYMLVGILIGMTFCSGCMTQTVTRQAGVGQSGGRVVSDRTVWVWQKEFWQHK
jgi:hypothetical protein